MAEAKRELAVRLVPNRGALYEIYYIGGGEVPDDLKGTYTSDYVANARIIMYLKGQIEKVKAAEEAAKIREHKQERMDELRKRDLA